MVRMMNSSNFYNPPGRRSILRGADQNISSLRRGGFHTTRNHRYGYYTTILQPGQHYLLAAYGSNNNGPYSSISNADETFAPGIADTGGIELVNSGGSPVDAVGMCKDTYFHEGNPLRPLSGKSDQSYERKPGGNTACYDTKDNAADFALISPATPLNQESPAVRCAGVILASPTRTPREQ